MEWTINRKRYASFALDEEDGRVSVKNKKLLKHGNGNGSARRTSTRQPAGAEAA